MVEFLAQLRIGIDIHLAPNEVSTSPKLGERVLHYITKMTFLSRIKDHFVHTIHCKQGENGDERVDKRVGRGIAPLTTIIRPPQAARIAGELG